MQPQSFSVPLSPASPPLPDSLEKTSRTVTRYDIATAIMKRMPTLSRREATRIFECALQEIADALSKREESVKLHEFGTFFVRERANRPGRDPLAAESAPSRPRRILNFRPSGGLKEKVERGQGHERNPRS